MYVDGVDQTASSNYAANNDNVGTFYFGMTNYYGGEAPNYFTGSLDEVRIWNVARTATEINSNKTTSLTGSETGLLAYYKFDQGVAGGANSSVTTCIDSKGSYTGTLNNFNLSGPTSNWVTGANMSSSLSNDASLSAMSLTYGSNASSFPSSLPTPLARYDASATNSMTISSGVVTQWNDLSGNGYNLTQSSSGPSVSTINGVQALDFYSYKRMTNSSVPLSTNVTILMAIQYSNTIATWGNFMCHGNHDDDWSMRHNADGSGSVGFHTYNDNNTVLTPLTNGHVYILVGRLTQSGGSNYVEYWAYDMTGTTVTKTATFPRTITAGNKAVYVGASDLGGEASNGKIGEIVYFNSSLDNTNLQTAVTYLQNKWFNGMVTPPLTNINLTPSFSSGTFNYTANVDSSIAAVNLTPTVNQANATVQVKVNSGSFATVASAAASAALPINHGNNLIETKVTAQDGTTDTSYFVQIYRGSLKPTITSFSPATGYVGSTVIITGSNFDTAAAKNIVYFGATKATVTAAKSDSLWVMVPAGATLGQITVTNLTRGLSCMSKGEFVPTYPNGKGTSFSSTDFATPVGFDLGASYQSAGLTLGDVDGDGKSDMIVPNPYEHALSILRNTSTLGNVSYASKQSFAVGTSGTSPMCTPAFVDLDGDGKGDIIVGDNGSNTLSIFRNTSTSGSISLATRQTVSTSATPYSIGFADFNGDGKFDLVVSSNSSATASVFPNTSTLGTISFGTKMDITVGGSQYHGIAIADFDGDGKTDFATLNRSSNSISIIRNTSSTSSMSFATKVDLSLATSNAFWLSSTDIDGDGKIDLAVTHESGTTMSVFRNISSSGTITFATRQDLSSLNNSRNICFADFNGDSKPDMLVPAFSGSAALHLNTSTSGAITFAAYQTVYIASYPEGGAVGDVDGDGKPDIVQPNWGGYAIFVTRNHPVSSNANLAGLTSTAGTLNPAFSATTTSYSMTLPYENDSLAFTPTLEDTLSTIQFQFNSNGYSNISNGTQTTKKALQVGSNTFDFKVTAQNGTTVKTYTISVVRNIALPSISGISPTSDTIGSLVSISGSHFNTTSSNNFIYFGAAKATVISSTDTLIVVRVPKGAAYGSITYIDLSTARSTASLQRFNPILANPKSTMTSADFSTRQAFTATGSWFMSAEAGDFDLDGDLDVVLADLNKNSISIKPNTSTIGNVSFGTQIDFNTITTINGCRGLATADVNGDGLLDILAVGSGASNVYIFKNTSTGGTISFAAAVSYPLGYGGFNVATADFDGDGLLDIVVPNNNKISVLRNTMTTNGTISYAARQDFNINATDPRGVVVGDIDGDGKIDIASANFSGNVSVLKNQSTLGNINFAASIEFATVANCSYLTLADFDGDGKHDIASTSENTYTYQLLLNTSTTSAISFATVQSNNLGGTQNASRPLSSDIDGDGKIDLIMPHGYNTVVNIHKNTGTSTGTISLTNSATLANIESTISCAVADIDGDGRQDIVHPVYQNMSVFLYQPQFPINNNSISSAQAICVGEQLDTLIGTAPNGGLGYFNYSWESSTTNSTSGFSAAAGTNNMAYYVPGSLSQTTWFKRKVTSGSTSYSNVVEITVNQIPTVAVTNPSAVCSPNVVDLTASSITSGSTSGLTLSYWTDMAATSTLANPSAVAAGTYYIKGTSTANCSAVQPVVATVNSLPNATATAASATTFCIGNAVTLNANTGTSLTYEWKKNGSSISGANSSSYSADSSGSYYVLVTDANNCSDSSSSVVVTVNPLPVVTLTGLQTAYCENNAPAMINASPSGGVFYGNGVSNGSFVPATGVGTYGITYFYTDGNGCSDFAQQTIVVNAVTNADFSGLSNSYCVSDADVNLVPNPAGGVFSGVGVNGMIFSPATGANSYNISYVYTNANGCSDTVSYSTQVNALPVLSLSGLDTAYCSHDSISTLIALPAGGSFSGAAVGNYFDPAMAATGLNTVVYTYTDANNCSNSISATTNVNAAPVSNLASQFDICAGDSTLIDAGFGAGYSYSWSNGANGQIITVDSTGFGLGSHNINVMISTPQGCSITDSTTLSVWDYPQVNIADTINVCGFGSYTVNAGASNGYSYIWSTGETTSSIVLDTTSIGGTSANMSVEVISPAGCSTLKNFFVKFNPQPIIYLGADTSICLTHVLTLDAGTAGIYLWSTNETSQTITVNGGIAGLGIHNYSVTITTPEGCIATDNINVMVNPCTSIDNENSDMGVEVYPNPTNGIVNLSIAGNNSNSLEINIFDIAGKVVISKTHEPSTENVKIDMSELTDGIYFVKIYNGSEIIVKKIVKE